MSANNCHVGRRDFLRLGGYGLVGAAVLGSSGCGVLNGGGARGDGGLVITYSRTFDNLDPHGAFAAAEQNWLVGEQIFDTPVVRIQGKITPWLVTRWENPDPTTWVMQVRDGVVFHDGARLTARDVAASIERQAKADSPLASLWKQLDRTEVPDAHTVVLRTKEQLGTVLPNLTLLRVVPEGKADQPGFFRQPIGTGPYRVTELVPGNRLVLEGNDAYWDGKPKTPRVVLRTVSEQTSRLTSIQTGEAHLTWPVAGDQQQQLEGNPDIGILTAPSYQYWFNCSRPPFTNPAVRKAMWHAVDTEALVRNIFSGAAETARAPIASSVAGFAAQQPYVYDPARAKALLAEAGMPNGFTTSLMWNPTQSPQIRQVAEAMISYWRDIGVQVRPEELQEAESLERLLALNWDMVIQTNVTATGDADYTLGRLYHSSAKRLGYANPELDELLITARRSLDQAERERLYQRACRIIWDDAPGIFPLEMRQKFAIRKNVQGFEPTPDESPALRGVRLA